MALSCNPEGGIFSTSPKFFKIILDSPNLRIPPKFMKRHGRNLQNHVLLKVPNRSDLWEVELIQSNGETLLKKGWQEFKERYSLALGDFVVFEYNGDSKFHVFMFDRTALEIDYPSESESDDDDNDNPIDSSDDSIVVLEHLSSKGKMVAKSSSVAGRAKNGSNVAKETSMEYQKALELATSHENLFFISIIQPSYISAPFCLELPVSFAKVFFPSNSTNTVTLRTKNGKKWSVQCRKYERRAKISAGWKDFVDDNGITVGDVCLFQVANKTKDFLLDVTIFPSSPAADSEKDDAPPRMELHLKHYNRSRVPLSREFGEAAGLTTKKGVMLRFEAHRQCWPVKVIYDSNFSQFKLHLSRGWFEFRVKYGLAFGKTYLLEYIPNQNLIQVKFI